MVVTADDLSIAERDDFGQLIDATRDRTAPRAPDFRWMRIAECEALGVNWAT